jgi:hypothetical protein
MTDILSYGDFIKQQAPAPKNESLGDLVTAAAKTMARQAQALAESIAPKPNEDRNAQIESVREDMGRALAEFADPRGHAVRAHHVRALAPALRLRARALPQVAMLPRPRALSRRGRCARAGVRARLLADAGGAAAVDHHRAPEGARGV